MLFESCFVDLTIIFVYQTHSQNLHCKINIYEFLLPKFQCGQHFLEASGIPHTIYVHIKSCSQRIKPFTSQCNLLQPSYHSIDFFPPDLQNSSVMVTMPENISLIMFLCCGDKRTVGRVGRRDVMITSMSFTSDTL